MATRDIYETGFDEDVAALDIGANVLMACTTSAGDQYLGQHC